MHIPNKFWSKEETMSPLYLISFTIFPLVLLLRLYAWIAGLKKRELSRNYYLFLKTIQAMAFLFIIIVSVYGFKLIFTSISIKEGISFTLLLSQIFFLLLYMSLMAVESFKTRLSLKLIGTRFLHSAAGSILLTGFSIALIAEQFKLLQ